MTTLHCCAATAVTLLLTGGRMDSAQVPQPARPVCTLQFKDHYRCNRDAFQQRLAAARTAHVETDRLDLFAQKQGAEMVHSLGKTPAEAGEKPDLVFAITPVDRAGRIELSPAAVALATLTVYDTAPGTGPGSRIWVETLDGDPDKPWPGVVVELLRKFQADALPH